MKKISKIQADRIRLKFHIKLEEEDTGEKLRTETKNNYRVKFEKFEEWVKANGFALSGILIGIGVSLL